MNHEQTAVLTKAAELFELNGAADFAKVIRSTLPDAPAHNRFYYYVSFSWYDSCNDLVRASLSLTRSAPIVGFEAMHSVIDFLTEKAGADPDRKVVINTIYPLGSEYVADPLS